MAAFESPLQWCGDTVKSKQLSLRSTHRIASCGEPTRTGALAMLVFVRSSTSGPCIQFEKREHKVVRPVQSQRARETSGPHRRQVAGEGSLRPRLLAIHRTHLTGRIRQDYGQQGAWPSQRSSCRMGDFQRTNTTRAPHRPPLSQSRMRQSVASRASDVPRKYQTRSA